MTDNILEFPPEDNKELEKYLDILSSPSDSLAAMVVSYKTLGWDRNGALICMAELARRRGLEEEFDFETFIEAEIQKIPKFIPVDLLKISQGLVLNIKSFTKIQI